MAPSSSSKALDLPIVSYSILPREQQERQSLSHAPQYIQFGYNDNNKEWSGYPSTRYMRWIQPLEQELSKQVEYDMDEQDKTWLDLLNQERTRTTTNDPISYEVFEVIMDKLEKEWFDLTKSIPKKSNAVPTENEKCSICDDGECENSNAIVFCDGCNLAVHQDCYGVPYIPEGQWLCRKCTVSPDKPVDCVFCPQPFGAFKQTTTGHWGHLLCAIWIPETGVSNTVYMEPIDGLENVPKSRWKLNCYLCKKKLGACIQCSNRNCYTAYHVTCAREFGLEVRMKQPGSTNSGGVGGELKSWCDKHGKVQWDLFSQSRAATPSSTRIPAISQHQSLPSIPLPSSSSITPFALPQSQSTVVPLASSKSLRSKKTHLSPIKQTPLIPLFIFERVLNYISKVKGLTGKKEVVSSICRYWSLKREGRTGAPLLKRIHLEPWTASASLRLQSDSDRALKLELIKLLRTDLEKVRILTEQVRKREKLKLEKLKWFKTIVLDCYIWGKQTRMNQVLQEIISWDKQEYFLLPIDRLIVPDYHEIISTPMNWTTMMNKLNKHEYPNAKSFADDARLVMKNAQIYNKPSSPVHKHCLKILEKLEPTLISLVKELDEDPMGEISIRESLAKELLLQEFNFKPPTSTLQEREDKVIVLEELDRVWYDVEDPLGDKEEKAKQAALQAEAEAEKEKLRLQKEQEDRIAQEKAEAEAEKAKVERARLEEEEEARIEKEQKDKEEQSRKERFEIQNLDQDVEMAPPTTKETVIKKNKRKADQLDGTDEKKSNDKKKKKMNPPTAENGGELVDVNGLVLSNRETFLKFEAGWVLPEGSSRRNKPVTPNTSTVPLPSTSTALLPAPNNGGASSSSSRQTPRASTAALPPTKPVPSRKGKEKDTSRGGAEGVEDSKPVISIDSINELKTRLSRLTPLVLVTDSTDLSDGTLVWHRYPGTTPFYPAEIADPNGKDMPLSLLNAKPKDREGKNGNLIERVPLLYFDEKRSGAWVLKNELRLLGESKEFDQLLCLPVAVKAYSGGKRTVQKCLEYAEELEEAYEWACSFIALEGEEEDEEQQGGGEGATAEEKKQKQKQKNQKRKRARR